jgi:hypothetical protein
LYETSDVKGEFLNIMNAICIKKIKTIAKQSGPGKEKWGLNYFYKAAKNWQKGLTNSQILLLNKNDTFKELLHTAHLYK